VVVLDIAGVAVPAAIADAPDFWRDSDGRTYRRWVKEFIKWVVGNPVTGATAVYIVFEGAPFPLKADTHAARRKTPEARAEIERQARAHDDAGQYAAGAKKWRELGYPIRAIVYDWLMSWCRSRAAKWRLRIVVAPFEADSQGALLVRRGVGDVLLSADGDHHAFLLDEWVQFKLTNGRDGEPATLRRFRTFTDVVGCNSFEGWTPSAFQLVLASGTTDLSRGVFGMGFASRVKLYNEMRNARDAPSDDASLFRLYLDKLDALVQNEAVRCTKRSRPRGRAVKLVGILLVPALVHVRHADRLSLNVRRVAARDHVAHARVDKCRRHGLEDVLHVGLADQALARKVTQPVDPNLDRLAEPPTADADHSGDLLVGVVAPDRAARTRGFDGTHAWTARACASQPTWNDSDEPYGRYGEH
jgi:hypothetical protein